MASTLLTENGVDYWCEEGGEEMKKMRQRERLI